MTAPLALTIAALAVGWTVGAFEHGNTELFAAGAWTAAVAALIGIGVFEADRK